MGVVEKCYIFRWEIGHATHKGHLHRLPFRLLTAPPPPLLLFPVGKPLTQTTPRRSSETQRQLVGVHRMFVVKVLIAVRSILQKTFTTNILSSRLTAPVSSRMVVDGHVVSRVSLFDWENVYREHTFFFSVQCLQPELKRNKYYGIS